MRNSTIDLRLVSTSLRLSPGRGVDPTDLSQLATCYGQAVAPLEGEALEIGVELRDGWVVSSPLVEPRRSDRIEDLVPLVDEQVVLTLQHARPELLFLHAAVLELDGRGVLLLAESGGGKSTTCLGLVRSGLGFFSDELAPLEPATRTVQSFPRALCLKAQPPKGYGAGAVEHRGRYYVPVPPADFDRLEVAALLFVSYDPGNAEPRMASLSPAEATLRLAAQGLNLLAHDDFALDLLAALATSAPAYQLASTALGPTCDLVLSELSRL